MIECSTIGINMMALIWYRSDDVSDMRFDCFLSVRLVPIFLSLIGHFGYSRPSHFDALFTVPMILNREGGVVKGGVDTVSAIIWALQHKLFGCVTLIAFPGVLAKSADL